MHVLVTGGAGFIGSHVVDTLLERGEEVTVVDDFNDFYDPCAKEANLLRHADNLQFRLVRGDIRDLTSLRKLSRSITAVVHLAARAGVRPSVADPFLYYDVNVRGTQNLLEFARERGVSQFVFASSSSVYGINRSLPWREEQTDLQPISPYASSKVSGEYLGHVYARLHGIRFIALRLFTVYGPRQRPDLAIHKFAKMIGNGDPIPLYGDAATGRDYTYVSDIVNGICAALDYSASDFEIVNLGTDRPIALLDVVGELERAIGRKAILNRLLAQPGDVPFTWADIGKAKRLLGYVPRTSFALGISKFVQWLEHEDKIRSVATAHVRS